MAEQSRRRWAPRRGVGLALLLLGVLLLAVNGIYFGYATYARNQVGDVAAGTPLLIPTEDELWGSTDDVPVRGAEASDTGELFVDLESLYPGLRVAAQDWAHPLWAEPVEVVAPPPPGFRPVALEALSDQRTAPPTRIRIPAINLDAEVRGLEILDLGDAGQYETPKHVVGHIPESANPGMPNNGWLFGHLESPIRGEGAVFRQLPQVYDLLHQSEDVYVIIDSADGSFLYQVRRFRTIPREELSLWDSDAPMVTLVTCWPRFKYDDRILVEAELVGVMAA